MLQALGHCVSGLERLEAQPVAGVPTHVCAEEALDPAQSQVCLSEAATTLTARVQRRIREQQPPARLSSLKVADQERLAGPLPGVVAEGLRGK